MFPYFVKILERLLETYMFDHWTFTISIMNQIYHSEQHSEKNCQISDQTDGQDQTDDQDPLNTFIY